MKTLHVLYDASCGLCRACREWLESQPQYVRLQFHAAQAPATARRFPGLGAPRPEELIAVDDRGGVYRHAHAWVMVLWALKRYRSLADTLSSPVLMPIARRVITAVSANRHRISNLLQIGPPREGRYSPSRSDHRATSATNTGTTSQNERSSSR